MCELTLPAISRGNYSKFDRVYHERYTRSKHRSNTAQNFNEILYGLKAFFRFCVGGSETILLPSMSSELHDGY